MAPLSRTKDPIPVILWIGDSSVVSVFQSQKSWFKMRLWMNRGTNYIFCVYTMHSGRVPLLLLGRSHLYRFIQIFLKFAKIYDKILKIFVKNWPDQILVKAQSKESKKLPPHYSEKVKTKIQQSPGQPGGGIWGKSGSAVLVFKRNGQKLNCYFSKLQNCCETIKR